MPNSARPGLRRSNARLHRSAQRSDSSIARSISLALGRKLQRIRRAASAMSEPSSLCISIGALRRQLDHRAVDMRAEGDAALRDLAQLRERHHLEAAGIGEDRPGQP